MNSTQLLPVELKIADNLWEEPLSIEPLQGNLLSPQSSPIRRTDKEGTESLYCFACKKQFNTKQTFDTHERGKKHKLNLQKIRKSISPMKPDRPQSHIPNHTVQQLEAKVKQYEALIQSKPNQAFKGIYLTAQSLIKESFIRAGMIILHKLLYHLQHSCEEFVSPWYSCMPIGRLILFIKTCMIIARLFQLPNTPQGNKVSLQYCHRAILCFIPEDDFVALTNMVNSYPFELSFEKAKDLYTRISEYIPKDYLKKEKNQDDPHDIYPFLVSLMKETAALFSLTKPSIISLSIYLILIAAADIEKRKEDYITFLSMFISIRDCLASDKSIFLQKTSKSESIYYLPITTEYLESMRGRSGIEERIILYEVTNNPQLLIECFLIALVEQDIVTLRKLESIQYNRDNSIHHQILEILTYLSNSCIQEDLIALLNIQVLPTWNSLSVKYPPIKSIFNQLSSSLTE